MPRPHRVGKRRDGSNTKTSKTKELATKTLTTLLLACVLLASCGTQPRRSDYFVVAFLPGTPARAQEGVEALDNAVKQAGRATPRFVAIDGVEPADGANPALEQQRAQAIVDAFVKSGIDAKIIHTDLRPAADKTYAARKDSFLIQLGYGDATPP